MSNKNTENNSFIQPRNLVENNVLICQSSLIEELLKQGFFNTDQIHHFYESPENDEEARDIYEWWVVSDFLLKQLKNKQAPILETPYGSWWGRTTRGQRIAKDSVVQEISQSLNNNY